MYWLSIARTLNLLFWKVLTCFFYFAFRNDKHKQAEAIFDELISRNPENHEYYTLMIEASKLATVDEKIALFDSFKEKYPKAQTPQRMQLDFATGKENKTNTLTPTLYH